MYSYQKVNPSGCGEYTQFYEDGKRISYEEICNRLNKQQEEDMIVEKSSDEKMIYVISLTDILKNLALIKKYNFETVYNDEKIYLCADYIEKELLKLRYSDARLETDW